MPRPVLGTGREMLAGRLCRDGVLVSWPGAVAGNEKPQQKRLFRRKTAG